MARYRFHASNGSACVFGAVGSIIRNPDRLLCCAVEVARNVMESLNEGEDWSEWRVSVHDLKGRRVLVQPFISSDEGMAQAA